MPRIAQLLGLSLILYATPWKAQSADTAAIQVSLTIRESCLIQMPQEDATNATRPQISCLHDAPHLTRRMTKPSSEEGNAPSTVTPMPTTWLIMF
jgi:hypothetical protein